MLEGICSPFRSLLLFRLVRRKRPLKESVQQFKCSSRTCVQRIVSDFRAAWRFHLVCVFAELPVCLCALALTFTPGAAVLPGCARHALDRARQRRSAPDEQVDAQLPLCPHGGLHGARRCQGAWPSTPGCCLNSTHLLRSSVPTLPPAYFIAWPKQARTWRCPQTRP